MKFDDNELIKAKELQSIINHVKQKKLAFSINKKIEASHIKIDLKSEEFR